MRNVLHIAGCESFATAVSQRPEVSKPRSKPPAPVNREISLYLVFTWMPHYQIQDGGFSDILAV
jgi:hypothetical protein